MLRTLCVAISALAILASSPAMSQTKQQQARESTGESNSQKQLGGQKRDRQITQHILRHEHERSRHAGAY